MGPPSAGAGRRSTLAAVENNNNNNKNDGSSILIPSSAIKSQRTLSSCDPNQKPQQPLQPSPIYAHDSFFSISFFFLNSLEQMQKTRDIYEASYHAQTGLLIKIKGSCEEKLKELLAIAERCREDY